MAGFREKRNRTGKKPALRAVAPGVVMQYGVRLRRVASVPLAGDATACAVAGVAGGCGWPCLSGEGRIRGKGESPAMSAAWFLAAMPAA